MRYVNGKVSLYEARYNYIYRSQIYIDIYIDHSQQIVRLQVMTETSLVNGAQQNGGGAAGHEEAGGGAQKAAPLRRSASFKISVEDVKVDPVIRYQQNGREAFKVRRQKSQ